MAALLHELHLGKRAADTVELVYGSAAGGVPYTRDSVQAPQDRKHPAGVGDIRRSRRSRRTAGRDEATVRAKCDVLDVRWGVTEDRNQSSACEVPNLHSVAASDGQVFAVGTISRLRTDVTIQRDREV